jgi:plastocyanin
MLGSAAALVAATGLFAATAASASASAAPVVATVVPVKDEIVKNTYSPMTMTVPVGTTVTWLNEDEAPHTVTTTKAPVAFDSGNFGKGKAFSYTFTKPGTYGYYCAVHPDMQAAVVVTDAPAAPAKPPAKPAIAIGAPTPPDSKAAAPAGMGSMTPPGQGDNGSGSANSANSDNGRTPAIDPVSGASDPFTKHVQAAHVNRSAAGQVHDLTDFDSYMKSHEYLFRQMLDYEFGHQSALGQAPVAGTFMQHMDAAHWSRSPAGQVSDIAEFDTWLKGHQALFRMMLDPAVGKSGPGYTAPGLAPFMQHMDAAHWYRSPGQQLEDIGDFQNWASAHAALIQAMLAAAGGGSTTR